MSDLEVFDHDLDQKLITIEEYARKLMSNLEGQARQGDLDQGVVDHVRYLVSMINAYSMALTRALVRAEQLSNQAEDGT